MSDVKKTLSEEDIDTERGVGRRSAMGVIGASVAAAAGVMAFEVPEAEAQCSDSDGGPRADPGGRGRRCGRRRRTGCSDPDGGRFADAAGRGRRCRGRVRRRRRRRGGCTDSDGGRFADAAGRGRRCRRSCSDPDGGRFADPAGRGRRC